MRALRRLGELGSVLAGFAAVEPLSGALSITLTACRLTLEIE